MRNDVSRKRSLAVVGFFACPIALASGSFFTQHIVRPTKRIVQYEGDVHVLTIVALHNLPISHDQSEDKSSMFPSTLYFPFVKDDKYSDTSSSSDHTFYEKHEDDNMLHILVDAKAATAQVDDLFQALKRRNVHQLQSKVTSDYSMATVRSPRQRNMAKDESIKEDSPTKSNFLLSYIRKLLVPRNRASESGFVYESEKAPIDTEDGIQDTGRIRSRYNITTEFEYNVSAAHVLPEETNSSVSTSSTTNDTNTVLYTKLESCNETCILNGTSNQLGDVHDSENSSLKNSTSKMTESDDKSSIKSESATVQRNDLFLPLRIRAFLPDMAGGGQHLTQTEKRTLLEQMVLPALLAWSSALRVKPVKGNLTVDPYQLSDGNRCGPNNQQLPSIPVPLQHIKEGVRDTDLIIYIGLAFTNNQSKAMQDSFVVPPKASSNFTSTLANQTKFKSNSSYEEKDFFSKNINGDIEDKEFGKLSCEGDYLAASTFCSTDQFDRPTAALLHICIDDSFFDPINLATNIRVIMHELGHALGFNVISMAHFRRSDGSPITKRTKTGEVPLTKINCTGPVTQNRQDLIALPSPEILQFRTVRNGIRVAEVVTPSVAQVVRNHFNCQELPGAELESGEFLPLSTNPGEVSCIGDHWERRLFQGDLMNPLVEMEDKDFNPRFSTLTLAFFADSGWYQADLSRANYPSIWGRGAGCAFVEQPCISEDGKVLPSLEPFFCSHKPTNGSHPEDVFTSVIQGCTPDLSRKAACSLDKYDGELPQEYQYFKLNYGADFGGNDPFMDYCPVYAGFSNGLCTDPENEAFIRVSVLERFGKRNSRCLSSQVRSKDDFNESQTLDNSALTGLCMPIACVVEDLSLRVQVDGEWNICTKKDEQLVTEINGDVVTVICPDPIRICPTFYCLRDCLGRTDRRTVCDYVLGDCICNKSIVNGTMTNCEADQSYPNSTSDNSVSPSEKTESPISQPFLFYNPNQNNSQFPDPESRLADYYVPSVQNLDKESSNILAVDWLWIAICCTVFVICAAAFIIRCWIRPSGLSKTTSNSDSGDDDQNEDTTLPDPNKHKMMASIVVNLRMNDPALQRRVQQDVLQNRASETDLSMTDTEGTTANPNDLFTECQQDSSREDDEQQDPTDNVINIDNQNQSESLNNSINCFGIDSLAPSSNSKHFFRRRFIPQAT